MRLNINYRSIHYHVSNSEGKTMVVAVLKEVHPSEKNMGFLLNLNSTKYNLFSDLRLKEVKGVARLKDGDESDLTLAKEVAKKKALRTAYREMGNIIAEKIRLIECDHDEVVTMLYSTFGKSGELDQEIVNMVHEYEE